MKAVILAGGKGTRIAEESQYKPKPMVEIGGRPIIWHIMKMYSAHGINDFIICCGYKGYMIKEYFSNYFLHMSDVTFDMRHNEMQVHHRKAEPWRVTVIDTGQDTMTGGRIKRVAEHIQDETFCLTYGDGVSDVNLTDLIAFHRAHGKKATLTAVNRSDRYGVVSIDDEGAIKSFNEKPLDDTGWINGPRDAGSTHAACRPRCWSIARAAKSPGWRARRNGTRPRWWPIWRAFRLSRRVVVDKPP